MIKVSMAVALAIGIATPAHADLRLRTQVEVRKLPTSIPPASSLGVLVNDTALRQPAAEDTTTLVGEGGARIELHQNAGTLPRDSVLLVRDGAIIVLNPLERTYWKLLSPSSIGLSIAPRVSTTRTGEYRTIAGLNAERVTQSVSMDVPLPDGVPVPPGLPTTVATEAEMWVTDRYALYGRVLAAATNAVLPTFGSNAVDGLVLLQITRNQVFGYEIESRVVEISEEEVAPALYEVPTDFREVPMPMPGPPR